ncbi:MAG: hypothetical protein H6634_10800 [Anaerolineales bacterium]|nr:hypothetical protein [Anaerolineales bacterium]MCB9111723.1 hypothetical protein [Anaerolineales bacterium]
MSFKKILSYVFRFVLIFILVTIFFAVGSGVMAGKLPAAESEPGLVSDVAGLLIICLVETVTISALILTSRWSGWKLIILLPLAYYGATAFMMQIETWYFLSDLTVGPDVLPLLFLMRVPLCFIAIPLAILILGKGKATKDDSSNPALVMPVTQWIWKAALIATAYVTLYWLAGYYIAWQNPELREFYGAPGEIVPFWTHTLATLQDGSNLFPFQFLRGLLWMLCTLPIIRGSKLNAWWTALLVGVMLSFPQNVAHIIANPLMPIASVRMSHLIETASSTFIFGVIVVWLLHRQHKSFKDLFGAA